MESQFQPGQPIQFEETVFGGGGLSSLFLATSAVSNLSTIVIPADAAIGDLAVLFDHANDAASVAPSDVVPTDWTGVVTEAGGTNALVRHRVSYKILASGDPGATITGMNDAAEDKVMLVFRGNVPVTSVTPSAWNSEVTGGNPTLQTVPASGQATPLVVFGLAAHFASTAAFSTASPAFDGTVLTADSDLIVGYKIYNSAPANHSIDMNDLGTDNCLASGYIRVT